MKTSQQGVDLLIAREGKRNGRLHGHAFFAAADLVDQGIGNAVVIGDPDDPMPSQKASPDFSNVGIFELRGGVSFSANIDKPSAPLMGCIFGLCNPFKILGSVVGFYPVLMVDRGSAEIPADKRHSDKSVNEMLRAFVTALLRNHWVSPVIEKGGKQLFRLYLATAVPGRHLYAAISRYQKFAALFGNKQPFRCVFHRWTIAQTSHAGQPT